MKLKKKISLAVICAIAITAFAALFITISISRNNFEDQFYSQAETAVKASKGGIESALTRAYETSLFLAQSPLTIKWLKGENLSVSDEVHNIMLNSLQAVVDKGNYATAFIGNKRTKSYYIGNKKGKNLNPNGGKDAWFYSFLNSGKKINANIDYEQELNKTMLWVNAISYSNNEPLGITGVGMNIKEFVAKFKSSIPTENSVLFVVDASNKVFLSSNDLHLGKNIYSLTQDSATSKRELESTGRVEYKDETHGTTLMVKSDLANTGLSMFLLAPRKDFVPSILTLGGLAVVIVILFTVISILGVMYILTLVFNKIDSIVEVANHISQGDLSVKIDAASESKDEIGELSKAMKNMVSALRFKAGVIDKMAQGDFSVEFRLASDKDELGKSLQQMLESLNKLLTLVNVGTNDLGNSSEQLSAISTQITSATTEMASQAGAVSGASNEMTSNIATSAASAEEMSANIQSISATTTEMSHNMSEVTQTIETLSQSINVVSEKSSASTEITGKASEMSKSATEMMSELAVSAHKIGEITEVIKEIAQQTNLLALNANIEAASAGEAGKGFAVVANEIKELAQQSSTSAESISVTVRDIQDKTKASEDSINEISDIVIEITESSNEVKTIAFEGTENVNNVLLNIKESAVGIEEIAKMINEISVVAQESARTSGELRNGSDEITNNISQLDIVVRETSKGIEKVNEQAKSLHKMADYQKEVVSQFRLKR